MDAVLILFWETDHAKVVDARGRGSAFLGFGLVKAEDEARRSPSRARALCAKCALKETKTCQNAVIVTKDGKKETYYLVEE